MKQISFIELEEFGTSGELVKHYVRMDKIAAISELPNWGGGELPSCRVETEGGSWHVKGSAMEVVTAVLHLNDLPDAAQQAERHFNDGVLTAWGALGSCFDAEAIHDIFNRRVRPNLKGFADGPFAEPPDAGPNEV